MSQVTSWVGNIFTIIGKSPSFALWSVLSVQKAYKLNTGIKYGLGRHSYQVDPSNIAPFGAV